MRHFLLFILLLLNSIVYKAQSFPERPVNYVNDAASAIPDDQERLMNMKLKAFEDSTSNQLFVYVAESLNGQAMSDLCQQIFHQWGIGQKNKNNGMLIAVFVKDRKSRIHVGYGLEGAVPDVLTQRIQKEYMNPYFKEGDYYGGVNAAVDQLIISSQQEYKNEPVASENEDVLLGFMIIYTVQGGLFLVLFYVIKKNFAQEISMKRVFLILGTIFLLIPFAGSFLLIVLLIIAGIIAAVRKSKWGAGTYTSSGSDSTWYSSSSSDSSWSSSDSSSSDSSFDGGGGGDSGGGGSDSSW